jgi:hypothetical protein
VCEVRGGEGVEQAGREIDGMMCANPDCDVELDLVEDPFEGESDKFYCGYECAEECGDVGDDGDDDGGDDDDDLDDDYEDGDEDEDDDDDE